MSTVIKSLTHRKIIFTAADLGVTLGAYVIGAGFVVTTTSIKAALDNCGFIPARMHLMVGLTTAGNDSFRIELTKTLGGISSMPIIASAATAINTAVGRIVFDSTDFVITNAVSIGPLATAITPALFNMFTFPFDDIIIKINKTTAVAVGTIDSISLMLEE